MYNTQMLRTRLGGALFVLTLLPATARAEEEPSTDPTEPEASDPLVTIPMPGAETPEAADPDDGHDETRVDESLPGDPWGDVGAGGALSLRALFQFTYRHTVSDRSVSERASYAVKEEYLQIEGDGWAINRLFLRVGSDPSRYLGFKAVFDFAELLDDDPEDVVKQAYAMVRAVPNHVELAFGMFKIPFFTQELDSSSRREFANFGALNALVVDSGYAGRDLGGQLLLSPLKKAKRLRISLGAFRGHAKDEHASPTGAIAGRLEAKPNKHFRFGVNGVWKLKPEVYDRPFEDSDDDELPDPPNPLFPAQKRWDSGRAAGVDVRIKKKGFMLRGEGIWGERVDVDTRYGARTFWGGWGVIAYRIELPRVQLLPAFRAEWLDADREQTVGVQRQLAGAFTVLFLERVRLLVDVTHTEVQANTPMLKQPKPLELIPYIELDNLRVIAQLQVEL